MQLRETTFLMATYFLQRSRMRRNCNKILCKQNGCFAQMRLLRQSWLRSATLRFKKSMHYSALHIKGFRRWGLIQYKNLMGFLGNSFSVFLFGCNATERKKKPTAKPLNVIRLSNFSIFFPIFILQEQSLLGIHQNRAQTGGIVPSLNMHVY